VVEAAIELADAEGLAALSMERVATRLRVSVMGLYRYVPGKTELVERMIEAAMAPPGDAASDRWRERVKEWAAALTSMFHRHPWSLEATGTLRVMGPRELSWLEAGLRALAPTGLPPRERYAACLVLLLYVRGRAQFAAKRNTSVRAVNGEQWETSTRELLLGRAAQYPELSAVLASPERVTPPRGRDFGLSCILDGIERRAARTKPDGR
jgi:AcrR family transcriptional regulator